MKKIVFVLIAIILTDTYLIAQGDLAKARQRKRWGYIDKTGNWAIQPQYIEAGDFSDGMARVLISSRANRRGPVPPHIRDESWGYLDATGNIAIQPNFEEAKDFHDGIARVLQRGIWQYCDKNGRLLNIGRDMKLFDFSDQLGRVYDQRARRWGFVDQFGKWVIPARFENVGDFNEGLAAASDRGKWGYIDKSGNWVIQPQFDRAKEFSNGMAIINSNRRWSYVNTSGQIITANFDRIEKFSDGLAAVARDKRWGFINNTGQIAIQPQFEKFKKFSEGLAPVLSRKQWGLIDKTGNWVIQPTYGEIKEFSQGLALVRDRRGWKYIDRTGNSAFNTDIFEYLGAFKSTVSKSDATALAAQQKAPVYQQTATPQYTSRVQEPAKPIQPSQTANNDKTPTYRGSGDPLKGLNVSKSRDMQIGDYYAFIIGVDNYSGAWTPLNNAVNDAKTIEQLLRANYKFDHLKTLYNENATRTQIIKELEWLVANVKEIDNVFIYYSGHGEYKQALNKGYWVPIDATTQSTSDYISNSDIQTFLNGIRSKHTLLVSDACFSGDIFRGNAVSVPFEDSDRYFKEVHDLVSRQAITSGGIEPVMDGGRDGHSVFAYYFIKALKANERKFMDASQVFGKLKIPVYNNSEQSPKFHPVKNTGDEGGQFIFIKK